MNQRFLILSNDKSIIQKVAEIIAKLECGICIHQKEFNGEIQTLQNAIGQYSVIWVDLDGAPSDMLGQVRQVIQNNRGKITKFIMLKTSPDIQDVRLSMKSGAIDFLEKPLDSNIVHYTLHELIGSLKEQRNWNLSLESHRIAHLQKSLAYDLIFGSVKNSKEIWDRSRHIGLSVVPNTAMAVHIDDFHKLVKNKSKQWEQSIRQEVMEGIEQYLKESIQEMLVIITDTDKIAVLLASRLKNSQLEYKLRAKELAHEIKEYVLKNTGYSITIGVGNYYEDARNLHVSYQEAYLAQDHKFFTGKNTVIHIDDIEPFGNEEKIILNQDIGPLANKLSIGDSSGVKKELEELKKTLFSQKNINPRVFQLQIIDILSTLVRAAIQGGAKPKDVFSIHFQYGQEMRNAENIEEIRHRLEGTIEQLLGQVLSSHNEQMLKSVQKAINYIDQHYHQPITLEEISNYVSLSANYFSNMFKKTTGYSFIEYVAKLRIEKAKAMLMDLDNTVYQIAGAVGYSDPRYFSRVFKQAVGKTPSQYRNSMLVTKFTHENNIG
ncbi:MAG TPA: helix-turn-helix domain-containing protein [Bacillaceae bacterium]